MPKTIGTQLKNARLDRNLSLKDVFEDTHIRIKYIEALEADDFSAMPSPVQGRGFLRLYAQYLNLDIDTLLSELRNTPKTENEFIKVEEKKLNLDEDTDSVPIPSIDEEESLWERFQHHLTEALARPEPAPVDEAESVPVAEASPKHARPVASHPAETSEKLATREEIIQYRHKINLTPLKSELKDESPIIFTEIGKTLEERREMLSLTFTEVEGHTHLRSHYLAALESGDFSALPSPVQTRGMLSNYANFLDLDADAILIRFAEGLQAQHAEKHLKEEKFEGIPKKRRRFSLGNFIAPDLIFGVAVFASLIAFTIWGLGRIANTRADTEVEATAPSIAEVLMTTPTLSIASTVTPTVMVNTPATNAGGGTEVPIEEVLPDENNLGVQILVTMMERAWLRVTVDGEVVFEGRSQPNATFVYEGNEIIEILTANGAGVRIAYNQRDMGLMGGFGEVVQRLYGARSILTPTVTPTSPTTATPSPTMTSTSTPTQTPFPTSTEVSE